MRGHHRERVAGVVAVVVAAAGCSSLPPVDPVVVTDNWSISCAGSLVAEVADDADGDIAMVRYGPDRHPLAMFSYGSWCDDVTLNVHIDPAVATRLKYLVSQVRESNEVCTYEDLAGEIQASSCLPRTIDATNPESAAIIAFVRQEALRIQPDLPEHAVLKVWGPGERGQEPTDATYWEVAGLSNESAEEQ